MPGIRYITWIENPVTFGHHLGRQLGISLRTYRQSFREQVR